jgi:hypothetical protein
LDIAVTYLGAHMSQTKFEDGQLHVGPSPAPFWSSNRWLTAHRTPSVHTNTSVPYSERRDQDREQQRNALSVWEDEGGSSAARTMATAHFAT